MKTPRASPSADDSGGGKRPRRSAAPVSRFVAGAAPPPKDAHLAALAESPAVSEDLPLADRIAARRAAQHVGTDEDEPWDLASLAVGSRARARDSAGVWLDAQVVGKRGAGAALELKMHFMGWASKWDEWLSGDAGRLRAPGDPAAEAGTDADEEAPCRKQPLCVRPVRHSGPCTVRSPAEAKMVAMREAIEVSKQGEAKAKAAKAKAAKAKAARAARAAKAQAKEPASPAAAGQQPAKPAAAGKQPAKPPSNAAGKQPAKGAAGRARPASARSDLVSWSPVPARLDSQTMCLADEKANPDAPVTGGRVQTAADIKTAVKAIRTVMTERAASGSPARLLVVEELLNVFRTTPFECTCGAPEAHAGVLVDATSFEAGECPSGGTSKPRRNLKAKLASAVKKLTAAMATLEALADKFEVGLIFTGLPGDSAEAPWRGRGQRYQATQGTNMRSAVQHNGDGCVVWLY